MEKHQLSTMIAGLSLLAAIILVIVPAYAVSDDYKKDFCEDNGGNWEDGMCDIDDEKADSYIDDIETFKDFQEDRAADEDALCDDPDANFDICNPTGRDDKGKEDDDDDDNDKIKKVTNKDDYDNDYGDKIKVINSDDDDDNKKYGVESKYGENEVIRYYDDEDDAEEAYENLDRDELTHSDKSFNDWEYDDEEHPALK